MLLVEGEAALLLMVEDKLRKAVRTLMAIPTAAPARSRELAHMGISMAVSTVGSTNGAQSLVGSRAYVAVLATDSLMSSLEGIPGP